MSAIALIDMGTNTFHLLLAERGVSGARILYRTHEAVKIGMAGINEGIINRDACQRAIAAMIKFRKIIDEHGVRDVYAFGTSAFRNAANGNALADEIRAATGITVRIISGEEEADLIFAGIMSGLDLGKEPSLVMDIGAGSVEFIIGNCKETFWKQSFEIGGQRLLERFHKHDPISQEEKASLNHYFSISLQPLQRALQEFRPKTLVGSSGTFDTLSEIYCTRQGIAYDTVAAETPLSMEGFNTISEEIISKTRNERFDIAGMIPMRVDMIVVACLLLRYVLTLGRFNSIRVSTYSLKEGALATITQSTIDKGNRN